MLVSRFFWLWILPYAAILIFLSLSPGVDGEPYFPHDDKLMHFAAYMIFSLLCFPRAGSPMAARMTLVFLILFGGLMEIGQSFVPNRHTSVLDFLANTLGVLAGSYLLKKFQTGPKKPA